MNPLNLNRIKPVQKLTLIFAVITIVLFTLTYCSASKRAAQVIPDPAPPPTTPQFPEPGQKVGDAYTVVDEMPMFPGGDAELLKFIAMNTRYPKEAKDQNIQGRVITRFKVNADGTVSDPSIIRGVNEYLDSEALKVVSAIPKFTPGKLNGVPVPVWYMVPITFTLRDDSPQRPSRFEVTGNDTIYSRTSTMPQFTGGNEALRKFKTENIKFPAEAKSLGIEGMVLVRFQIEKDGSLTNIRIVQGVSPTIDAEALRVTKMMPAWEPGKENGRVVKFSYMTNYDFLLTPRTPPVVEKGAPFVVVEEMPMFPGGDSILLDYIKKNTKYPDNAKKNGIEGRVIIRFCVTDTGGIDRVSVLKGVDPELDAEAIRVVKTLPKFKPGKQGGKPVNVWYMVPITFGLDKPAIQTVPGPPPPPPPPPSAGYDEVPLFPGGEAALYKFINSNVVYPKAALEQKISGKVVVRFSINTDGSIGNITVVNGINTDLNAEAIRVIRLLPDWQPGKLNGTPVVVSYPVTITFMLK